MSLWKKIPVRFDFTSPLCGGVPRSDDIMKNWCAIRAATGAAYEKLKDHPIGPDGTQPRPLEVVQAERMATIDALPTDVDQAMERSWVGFSKDAVGLFIRGANIRAHLKDCAASIAKMIEKKTKGTLKQFKAKLCDRLYVKQQFIHILDANGQPIRTPDEHGVPQIAATGYRDATMSVITAQGPRQCLKRVDYCFPARIDFTLMILDDGIIEPHLPDLFEYGEVHGTGQDRSLQFGQYTATIMEAIE